MYVVSQLAEGFRGVRLLPGGGFELHHHQGQTVDEQHHIRALLRVLHHRPLVGHHKVVIFGVLVVHQIHQGRALLAPLPELHRNAVLQVVGEGDVLL